MKHAVVEGKHSVVELNYSVVESILPICSAIAIAPACLNP